MEARIHPPKWKTLLAFAIIYLVWGSTFFAIRLGAFAKFRHSFSRRCAS
jgi:hypothetical protein